MREYGRSSTERRPFSSPESRRHPDVPQVRGPRKREQQTGRTSETGVDVGVLPRSDTGIGRTPYPFSLSFVRGRDCHTGSFISVLKVSIGSVVLHVPVCMNGPFELISEINHTSTWVFCKLFYNPSTRSHRGNPYSPNSRNYLPLPKLLSVSLDSSHSQDLSRV